jgi:hypothetical protein
MIRRMALGEKNGMMALSMRATFLREKSIIADSTGGPIPAATMVFGTLIQSRVQGSIAGQMVVNIQEPGKTINFTVMESTHGQMGGNTKANTLRIRNRVWAFTNGLMEGAIMDNGSTVSSMAKESSPIAKAKAGGASGTMAIDLGGSKKMAPKELQRDYQYQTPNHNLKSVSKALKTSIDLCLIIYLSSTPPVSDV